MKTFAQNLFSILILLFSLQSNIYSQSDQQADQKAWMEYMTPGSVHEMMAKSDGDWNEDITFWMAPDAPPTKSSGTVTNKMILGGRYQYSVHTGNMMGMPFEGINILGYDNARKVFQSSWIDNFGTGISNTEGTWDEGSKTIEFVGKSVDPMSGKEMDIRQTFKIIDDKSQFMEMYMTSNGKESKTMEIILTRK